MKMKTLINVQVSKFMMVDGLLGVTVSSVSEASLSYQWYKMGGK